jgi:hypothetical protein
MTVADKNSVIPSLHSTAMPPLAVRHSSPAAAASRALSEVEELSISSASVKGNRTDPSTSSG